METPKNPANRPEHPTLSSSLLDGVQQMDSESWSRLVNTFAPIVYLWCRTSGVRSSESPDIVQNVFTSVARGIGSFERQKDQGSFRSWLATITRNQIRDHFRKKSQIESAVGGTEAWDRLQHEPDELDSTIAPENVTSAINRRVLDSVQAEFEPQTWQAFWLTVVDGKNTAEASEATGISTASIYQAKSRVLRRLRARLAELPD
ncbi:MAG: sigma-70 family RNA polymerase sigma factor [Planctomycetales bacterium]|nr:sigma-70 family RNA polymerase sigma factor [Planctomycetales bacterium]